MRLGPLFKFPYKNTRLDGRGGLVSQFFGESQRRYMEVIGTNGHNGIDFAVPNDTKIIAPIDMYITQDGVDSKGGIFFVGEVIENETLRYELIFVHNQINFTAPRTWMKKGEVVAISDNTGWSSGPHLHFGIRVKIFDAENKVWQTLKNNNKGYIDPLPFFSGTGYEYTPNNMMFNLIRKKGDIDVWAKDEAGIRHLIINDEVFAKGVAMKMWTESVLEVDNLFEPIGNVIIIVKS